MKTICPRCGTEYDLDDSMNGKKVECECGGKWVVTFSPAPSSAAATPVRRKKRKKGYDPALINSLNLKEHERYKPVPMGKQVKPVFIMDFPIDTGHAGNGHIHSLECETEAELRQTPHPSSVSQNKKKKKYDPTLINVLNLKERENYTPVPMIEKQELPVFIEDFDKDSSINVPNSRGLKKYKPTAWKNELSTTFNFDKDSEQHADENIRCPECGSTQITANKKGINVANAVIGSVLFGGIGILAGLVGKDKIIITCLNCGHHWQPGEKTVKPE